MAARSGATPKSRRAPVARPAHQATGFVLASLGVTQLEPRAANIEVLEDLCNTMKFGSLCALGGFTPNLVMSGLNHFSEDFGARQRLRAAE
jgi:NADH:ubiquinone oxidoreductase subunit F (NADH-binding)